MLRDGLPVLPGHGPPSGYPALRPLRAAARVAVPLRRLPTGISRASAIWNRDLTVIARVPRSQADTVAAQTPNSQPSPSWLRFRFSRSSRIREPSSLQRIVGICPQVPRHRGNARPCSNSIPPLL